MICLEIFEDNEDKNQGNPRDDTYHVYPLEGCSNLFHKECLQRFLISSINQCVYPLKCPDHECRKLLLDSDLRALISIDIYEKYLNYSIQKVADQQPDIQHCPNPGCGFAFAWDQNQDEPHQICKKCQKKICIPCKTIFHQDQSCEEYKRNQRFDDNDQKFIDRMIYEGNIQCTRCRYWIQKKSGCDHVTCGKCGFDMCFNCGGVYLKCRCKYDNKERSQKYNQRYQHLVESQRQVLIDPNRHIQSQQQQRKESQEQIKPQIPVLNPWQQNYDFMNKPAPFRPNHFSQ
ncbi:ibr domain containing protein [Stylonychia lemnae]|uniref:Ibr domain containing protein n=1 Tax=Stylonychia lemnae TaxID=5949 RepID=A0A078AQ38_STYLE|nr:ibr domain containing protein [Stylonychia lemnae]|eukprot:CDW84284.1 ibr domain containing protein [Stylonychia lemnae]